MMIGRFASAFFICLTISNVANDATTSAPVTVPIQIITPGSGVPTSITVTPSSVNELDTATAGTVVASISVVMSDASPYVGTPTSDNPLFGISGMNVVLARDLTSDDDGFYNITISP